MFESLVKLAGNAADIVVAPVEVIVDVTNAVVEPVADVAKAVRDEVKDVLGQ